MGRPLATTCRPFTSTHLGFLDQLTQSIGVVLNTIEATMRTENLLQQSQTEPRGRVMSGAEAHRRDYDDGQGLGIGGWGLGIRDWDGAIIPNS